MAAFSLGNLTWFTMSIVPYMGEFWRDKTLVNRLIWTNWRVKCYMTEWATCIAKTDSKRNNCPIKVVNGFLVAKVTKFFPLPHTLYISSNWDGTSFHVVWINCSPQYSSYCWCHCLLLGCVILLTLYINF